VQSGALDQGAQFANVPDVFEIEEALDEAGCRRKDRLHQVASLLYHFEFTGGDDFAIDIQVGVIE